MGKYDSIGGAVHKGDMDRAQLALQRQQLAQRAQAQQFEQQRAMALDAERREDKVYARKQAEEEMAYKRGRDAESDAHRAEETAYRRKMTQEAADYARGRDAANDAYRASRDAVSDARDQRDFAFRQQASDISTFLQNDANARAQERHAMEMAEFERINAERMEAQRQQDSSFASLVEALMTYGDDDGKGNILLATPYMDAWNKMSGANLGGISISYSGINSKTGAREELAVPVVSVYERDSNGQVVNPRQLSNNQLKMMFATFPGVTKAMGGRLNNTSRIMEALGLGVGGRGDSGLSRKDTLSTASEMLKQAQERYDNAIAPGSGVSDDDKKTMLEEIEYFRKVVSELSGIPAYDKKNGSGSGTPRFQDTF